MSKALRLIATLDLKPGSWEKVSAAILESVVQSRKEAGNHFYTAHFEQGNHNHVVFVEHWASQEAIEFHTQTEHFKNMMTTVQPYLERPMQLLTLTEIKE